MLSDTTLADKAYSLVLFFRFLERNSLELFELSEQTLKPFILHFRNELLYRVRQLDQADGAKRGSGRRFNYARASRVLTEVGSLCAWWNLTRLRTSSRFVYPRWRSAVTNSLPEYFNIAIPRARQRFRENHVLEPDEVEGIWNYLTSEARPSRPNILSRSPSGPKRGWSPKKAAAWKFAQGKYRHQSAWFHRQQMLWALFIGSGMRRSEIPLIMFDDVRFHGEDLWVALRLRKSTESLGKAKTGPRTVFIGWDHRIITAWQNWCRSRQVLVCKWTEKYGMAKHGMFLTNQDGGPLTVDGLDSLFESLNVRFGVFGGEFFEDQFRLHPHAIRHTVESLFELWNVPRDVRQRHLGHKKAETTDLYGKVYRKTYVEVLEKLLSEVQV